MKSTGSVDLFDREVVQPILNNISQFSANNAFCINEVFYTYKEFGEYIARIRAAVKRSGPDNLIGLVANDDIETYASIIAFWLEGKAYIPLHPKHPLDRSEEIIRAINITTIFDSGDLSVFSNYHVIYTSQLSDDKGGLAKANLIDQKQLAYVLFTSGSTGNPKGVTINRENVAAFIEAFWATGIEIKADDKCLQCFDLTFDVSVQAFLAPLLRGACVFTVPHEEIKYSYCYGLFDDHQLTFCVFAPSMLRYLKPYFDEINLPAIRYCILTAEASPVDLIKAWEVCVPNASLYNFYGPTETTIYCTYYKIPRNQKIKTLNGMLSIGRPMNGVGTIIIDESEDIVGQGEKGELCITGLQVTKGYWNNAEVNMASFLQKEYKGSIRTFYRTGDLCFCDEAGDLMLYGRNDSQVKIHGHRVDLGELEYHARNFTHVSNAVVIPFTNRIGNTELVLFTEGRGIDSVGLSEYMKTKVPLYLMPSRIILENQFDLNGNSKVDKTKLKEKLKQNL